MADICKCKGNVLRNSDGDFADGECPLRAKCYRFTAPTSDYRQSYGMFAHDVELGCPDYWPNEKEDSNAK